MLKWLTHIMIFFWYINNKGRKSKIYCDLHHFKFVCWNNTICCPEKASVKSAKIWKVTDKCPERISLLLIRRTQIWLLFRLNFNLRWLKRMFSQVTVTFQLIAKVSLKQEITNLLTHLISLCQQLVYKLKRLIVFGSLSFQLSSKQMFYLPHWIPRELANKLGIIYGYLRSWHNWIVARAVCSFKEDQ